MRPRSLIIILVTLLIPVFCIAAPKKKKPAHADDRSLKAVTKISGDSRQRIALVIGNSNYLSSPLKNPAHDAHAMSATLRRLGFEVIEKTNLSYSGMNEAIESFGERLRPGGVALFYYAGHGMQVQGSNYLIPTDAKINTESEVRFKSVDAGLVLVKMEAAKSDVNIAIMDACRDNPFSRSFRGSAKGLAQVDAPSGTLIAFATAPGKTAADGTGNNGVYTEALIKAIETPGMKLEEVFKQVRRMVVDRTAKAQTPWESSSLMGDFHFIPPTGSDTKPAATQTQVAMVPSTATKTSNDLDEIIAKSEAEERSKKERAERIKADVAKYEKILASPRGAELKQAAWNALVGRYPEAGKVEVGDIYGFMAALKVEGYEAEEGQDENADKGIPARPNLPFSISENLWQIIEGSEAYRKAPKVKHLTVTSNAQIHTEYTGTESRTLPTPAPSDYNTQKEIIPVSDKCYAVKTFYSINNTTNTDYYCGYAFHIGTIGPVGNNQQLTKIDEISGSLFPMRVGAKRTIKHSTAYLQDRRFDWLYSTNCTVISRNDAKTLHPKLSGAAWKVQCNTSQTIDGKTTNSTGYDYYLSDLKLFAGEIGTTDPSRHTAMLPVSGTTTTFEAKDYRYGSRSTYVYSHFDWSVEGQNDSSPSRSRVKSAPTSLGAAMFRK